MTEDWIWGQSEIGCIQYYNIQEKKIKMGKMVKYKI